MVRATPVDLRLPGLPDGPVTAWLAPEGYADELAAEVGEPARRFDRLVVAPGPPRPLAWAQNTWFEPAQVRFRSISQAARALRAVQRNWVGYSWRHHRRAALIGEQLPVIRFRPVEPYSAPPQAPLGSWTLLDRHTMLYAPRCSSPYPHGELRLREDRQGPPSRAYLKLWELFTREQCWPRPGDRVLDLGSAPGGWSWVLAELGARVLSVDRADLAPEVAARPEVEHRRGSAFALDPEAVGPVDWLFSDVICYPDRLWTLVERWLRAGTAQRFVCTVKLQGAPNPGGLPEVLARFARVPGARLLHLTGNRHELTWVRW